MAEINTADDDGVGVSATVRKIVHVDMDAFYASVEQRDNPELRGKPVAVGGSRQRGVVAAASYEARAFGVRSAMPSVTAQRKCPDLIFVKPRFDVYKSVSAQIHTIFAEYTPLIEPLSLDEAYLDVTDNLMGIALGTEVAQRIRRKIFEATGLTASAGISYNKFLAKMASSQRKPNGQFVIPPGKGEAFVATLPIGKFYGVGPATAERMQRLDITNGAELKTKSLGFLQQQFGKAGSYFYWVARGVDHRAVHNDRIRKSVGAENTFATDLSTLYEARVALVPIIEKVSLHCDSKGIAGRTVTLKVKYADFEQITRSRSVAVAARTAEEITLGIEPALNTLFPTRKGIRLLGVTLSGLVDAAREGATPDQMVLAL
ncbi:MAG: dinB [Devosia sp.]|uniref:DNA polymerase IV n=1 Tax=Devosia sp. TaxID=1871048 RepID=UPI00261FE42D|nr:DNA polymerase IV [Devosia sp.]MDB5528113.1 dinB [Devosia sp.]